MRRRAKKPATPVPSNSIEAGSGVADTAGSENSRLKLKAPLAAPPPADPNPLSEPENTSKPYRPGPRSPLESRLRVSPPENENAVRGFGPLGKKNSWAPHRERSVASVPVVEKFAAKVYCWVALTSKAT